MSSIAVVERLLTTIGIPALPQARAVADSPSECAILCRAVGATSKGNDSGISNNVVADDRLETSTITRYQIDISSHAERLRDNVRSSPAPPA